MHINRNDTAVVFIDPQNEVLSERGDSCCGHFIEGAPGRRGRNAVRSPRSRRKGHTR